jgi:hypothetical protein
VVVIRNCRDKVFTHSSDVCSIVCHHVHRMFGMGVNRRLGKLEKMCRVLKKFSECSGAG